MVADGYRRRGIGRALMESAEAWAKSVGVRKVELHVFPHNEAALTLYERLGYRQVGIRRSHFRRSGGYVDAILRCQREDVEGFATGFVSHVAGPAGMLPVSAEALAAECPSIHELGVVIPGNRD